jgi:predicted RNA-binding Zn-ribbon protein involved in translation (DUF1610 family)
MPGTNAGTGQPLSLRCAKCRRWNSTGEDRSRGFDLEATGRTRPAAHRGVRQTNRRIEYRCKGCGHVGWTQHLDAEALLRRKSAP